MSKAENPLFKNIHITALLKKLLLEEDIVSSISLNIYLRLNPQFSLE